MLVRGAFRDHPDRAVIFIRAMFVSRQMAFVGAGYKGRRVVRGGPPSRNTNLYLGEHHGAAHRFTRDFSGARLRSL